VYPRPRPHGSGLDGVEYIFSGRPIAFFNVAVLTGRGIDTDALKARAERACAWSSNKGVPWLFIVTREAMDPATDPGVVLDAWAWRRSWP
jgi:hypothetical protein